MIFKHSSLFLQFIKNQTDRFKWQLQNILWSSIFMLRQRAFVDDEVTFI